MTTEPNIPSPDLDAGIDYELVERLRAADAADVIVRRLDRAQLNALLSFAGQVYARDSLSLDLQNYLTAWSYGFQIGHDLVVSDGAIAPRTPYPGPSGPWEWREGEWEDPFPLGDTPTPAEIAERAARLSGQEWPDEHSKEGNHDNE